MLNNWNTVIIWDADLGFFRSLQNHFKDLSLTKLSAQFWRHYINWRPYNQCRASQPNGWRKIVLNKGPFRWQGGRIPTGGRPPPSKSPTVIYDSSVRSAGFHYNTFLLRPFYLLLLTLNQCKKYVFAKNKYNQL